LLVRRGVTGGSSGDVTAMNVVRRGRGEASEMLPHGVVTYGHGMSADRGGAGYGRQSGRHVSRHGGCGA